MKMKKTVIGVLALALVIGQLSGCSGNMESVADSSTTSVADSVSTVEETVEATKEETVEATSVESVADTSQEETELTPTTEETSGINEEELREHGKQWYAKYKDEITCDEETFVNEFIEYVIGGYEEPDAATQVYLTYLKVVLQEPAETEPPVTEVKPVDDGSDVAEVVVKPVQTTKPVEEKPEPVEEKPAEETKPKEETKPAANDYSDIKWGDPIPDNLTSKYGEAAERVIWADEAGGKFVYIDGLFYNSIQDWADGKDPVPPYTVSGKTLGEALEEQGVWEWE